MKRSIKTRGKSNKSKLAQPRRPKAPSDKELYKLLSQAAKVLFGPRCEICGNLGSQAMHFHSKKGHPNVKFDLRNILWACTKCHIFDSHIKNDTEHARAALIKRIGYPEFYSLFTDAHNDSVKLTAMGRDALKVQFLHTLSGTSDSP